MSAQLLAQWAYQISSVTRARQQMQAVRSVPQGRRGSGKAAPASDTVGVPAQKPCAGYGGVRLGRGGARSGTASRHETSPARPDSSNSWCHSPSRHTEELDNKWRQYRWSATLMMHVL